MVILSRSFCNVDKITHMGIVSSTFVNGINKIRELEAECMTHRNYFKDNEREVSEIVHAIVEG